MSQTTFTLKDGLLLDDKPQKEIVIREATAGDVIDASVDSEKLILNDKGEYELVPSPTLVGAHVLCKQIVRIGDIEGPLTIGLFKKLSTEDMRLIQDESEKLETASLKSLDNNQG